jgi:tetratricopeptide (TPR) repeat protein
MSRAAMSILMLALLSATAAATESDDPRIIRDGAWNDSVAAAQVAGRYTGRPVLIFFFEDWCGYCEQVERFLTRPELRETMSRFILVKTTVAKHEELARSNRITLHHQILLLDWSGEVLGRITEFTTEKDAALAIAAAAATNDLSAGRKLMELGRYAKAAERLRLAAAGRDKSTQDEAKKALARIGEIAQQRLAAIRAMIRANRREEALDALNAFLEEFPSDAGHDDARKLAAMLKSGKPVVLPEEKAAPAAPPPGPEPSREEAAKRLLERGMAYEWEQNYLAAVSMYLRTARNYDGTAAAVEAAKRARLFLGDPALFMMLARQQMDLYCRRMLETGALYERTGRDDEAILRYRSVMELYPDTNYAAEALKRLVEIERRHMK